MYSDVDCVLTCAAFPPPSVPLSPAVNLRFSNVDHSSARLTWDSTSRKVNSYHIMYVKTNGVQTNEVRGPFLSLQVADAGQLLLLLFVKILMTEWSVCALQVDVGRVSSWLLTNLTSMTEYTVGVLAIYDEGQAEAATDSFITSRNPHQLYQHADVLTTFQRKLCVCVCVQSPSHTRWT